MIDIQMDWLAVSAMATAGTGLILGLSLLALYRQVVEVKRATYAQAVGMMMEFLQNENLRAARRQLYGLAEELDGKHPREWTSEQVEIAEQVCHTYNSLAIMFRYGLLPKELSRRYNNAVARSWKITAPLVRWYRTQRGMEWWTDFEWMGEQQIALERAQGK